MFDSQAFRVWYFVASVLIIFVFAMLFSLIGAKANMMVRLIPFSQDGTNIVPAETTEKVSQLSMEQNKAIDVVQSLEEVKEFRAQFNAIDGINPKTGGHVGYIAESVTGTQYSVLVFESLEERNVNFGFYIVDIEKEEVVEEEDEETKGLADGEEPPAEPFIYKIKKDRYGNGIELEFPANWDGVLHIDDFSGYGSYEDTPGYAVGGIQYTFLHGKAKHIDGKRAYFGIMAIPKEFLLHESVPKHHRLLGTSDKAAYYGFEVVNDTFSGHMYKEARTEEEKERSAQVNEILDSFYLQ